MSERFKILIIDDDLVMLKLAEGVLTSGGYKVHCASEAPDGLEWAMKKNPDLIVLDVMMPVINGFNICRLLKSQETHRHIPIILLTSRTEEDDRRIGDEVGADSYLPKPLDTEALLQAVRGLLQKDPEPRH